MPVTLAFAPAARYAMCENKRAVRSGGEENRMASSVQIAQGASVVDSKGRTVGRVLAVEYEHIVVEQGFLFTHTLYVPTSAIARVEGASARGPGRVHLTITGKQAMNIG